MMGTCRSWKDDEKPHWLCRMLGHRFEVAYDSEEGEPTVRLDAALANQIAPVVIATRDSFARVIAASKPLKQNATCIFCSRCGLTKARETKQ